MTHRLLTTAAGTVVHHSHPDVFWEWSEADKTSYQSSVLTSYAGTQALSYVHLNHSSEVLLPTRRYNCWGFTFNPRQCWIDSGTDVQHILNDNGTAIFVPNIRVGDVICYRDESDVITHTGRVWSINAAGEPSLIQSKWGSLGEYLHPPLTVPAIYGTNISYWRVTPLSGKGDAWHKDIAADDRLPCSPGELWMSPDLWCNNSGGTSHHNPVRGLPNQLYARLHNPDTLAITNATVHLYWADPTGGIPHSDWQDIGTATVSVPPGGTAIAGPVSWTPGGSVPDHACLLAIADTGDNPCAAATLDPIVWPFDVARDNNIVQKNVSVVPIPPPPSGKPHLLPFTALNPDPIRQALEVHVGMHQVQPKDLGPLGLDLQGFHLEFTDQAKQGHWLPCTVRPRPSALRAFLLWLLELLLAPLRFLRLIPPKPIAVEVELGAGQGLFKLHRQSPQGVAFVTPPLAQGEGGRLSLRFVPSRAMTAGQAFRIDIEQRVDGLTTGGMTYVVVVARNPDIKK